MINWYRMKNNNPIGRSLVLFVRTRVGGCLTESGCWQVGLIGIQTRSDVIPWLDLTASEGRYPADPHPSAHLTGLVLPWTPVCRHHGNWRLQPKTTSLEHSLSCVTCVYPWGLKRLSHLHINRPILVKLKIYREIVICFLWDKEPWHLGQTKLG